MLLNLQFENLKICSVEQHNELILTISYTNFCIKIKFIFKSFNVYYSFS